MNIYFFKMIKTFFLISFIFFMNNAHSSIWPTYVSSSKRNCYKKAAVSTDSVPCARVGADILRRNGSAVDAAIAMLICVGANNPQSSGIGGGFLMVYYNRLERKSYVIDAKEVAPMKAKKRYESGPKSIAVPGELAGYAKAHSLFGRLPWKKLFTPTIKMCKKGILVSKHLVRAIGYLTKGEKIRKTFCRKGRPYKKGERIKMPKLAKTLKIIAKIGKKALYGPSKMARKFLSDLKAAGSQIDKKDLLNYKPIVQHPVQIRIKKGITLHTTPTPGAGLTLGSMIGSLDYIPGLNEYSTKIDYKAVKIMSHLIYINRFVNEYDDRLLLSNSHEAKKLFTKFSDSTCFQKTIFKTVDSPAKNPKCEAIYSLSDEKRSSTTHISVLAPNGDAVSVTSSINKYFGSHIISSSTGIILNNQMADFANDTMSVDNLVEGGKRPKSSMCPSIFVDASGDVKLVIGAAGGLAIGTTLMQIAARNLYLGENIKQSIDAPRFHAYADFVRFEKHFPKVMRERLKAYGHTTQLDKMLRSVAIGIERTPQGKVCANSDFRKGGTVDGF